MKKQFTALLLLLVLVGLLPGSVNAARLGEKLPQEPVRDKFLYFPAVYRAPVEYTLVGAGDIAECDLTGAAQTARLLGNLPGAAIFTAGDNAYPDGSAANFRDCFAPTWGKYKAQIHPALGNHDYHTAGASAYFNYFGAAAHDPQKGYYAYSLGKWRIIVLNSVCAEVSCKAGSAQEQWLKAELANNPTKCTLAYWHEPRFSIGKYGNSTMVLDFWKDLYAAGADVVVNGHNHAYERFAPQDPYGKSDPTRGIREFVVGTGGGGLYDEYSAKPNIEKHFSSSYGVLKLMLTDDAYSWEFIPVKAGGPTDSGSGECH